MLRITKSESQELYAVYYLAYGSLAGRDGVSNDYFWSGPYPDIKTAIEQAQKLKISHDNDDSFVVRKYRGEGNKNGAG